MEEFKTIDVNSIISADISSLNSAEVSVGDYTISSDLSPATINTISKDVIGYNGSTPMYGYSSSKNPFSSSINSTSSSFSKTPIWRSDEDDLQSRIELSDDFKKDILTKLLELDKDTLDIILNLLRGHLENIIDDPELLIKIDERDKEILDLKKEVSDLKKEINEIRKELIRKVPGNYGNYGNNGISIDPRTGGGIMYDGSLYNYIHEDVYTYLESKLKESILNCDNKNSISNNIDNADKNAF